MSGAKWQNIAGSKNFFSHNFKEEKNGLVNLSFMPFLAIFKKIICNSLTCKIVQGNLENHTSYLSDCFALYEVRSGKTIYLSGNSHTLE